MGSQVEYLLCSERVSLVLGRLLYGIYNSVHSKAGLGYEDYEEK